MNKLFRFALIVSMLLLGACSSQQVREGDQDISELLTLMKVDDVLVQLPALIAGGMDQMEGIDQAKREKLGRELSKAFEASLLKREMVRSLSRDYSADRYRRLKIMVKSDLQQRMLALEMEVADPAFYRNLTAFLGALDKNPPNPQRVQLMQQLVDASNSVEASVTVQMGFMRGMLKAAIMLDPPAQRMSQTELEATFKQLEAQVRQATLQQEVASQLYLYRKASDADIKAYVEYYRNPDMSWFIDQYVAAFARAFEVAGKLAVDAMASAAES